MLKKELVAFKNDIKGAALYFDVSERTIRRWLQKYDLYRPLQHYGKKLNLTTAQEIRDLYFKKGWTQEKIACKFSVSQPSICKIVNNVSYKSNFKIAGTAKVTYAHT